MHSAVPVLAATFQTRVHSAYLWYVPLELLSIQFRLSDNFFTTELVNSRSHILDGLNSSNFLAIVFKEIRSSKPENLALQVELSVFLIKKNFHFEVQLKIE